MASVIVSDHGTYETAATTDSAASAVVRRTGGSLPGRGRHSDRLRALLPRHPLAGPGITSGRSGGKSAASYRLTATSPATEGTGGSLNTYGTSPDPLSDEAQQIGLILAAHASIAAKAVLERDALQDLAQNLHKALLSRDVIGQAKGILMERLKITRRMPSTPCVRHPSGSTRS